MITTTEKTTIQISVETRDKPDKIGTRKESYDSIISRVLEERDNQQNAKEWLTAKADDRGRIKIIGIGKEQTGRMVKYQVRLDEKN